MHKVRIINPTNDSGSTMYTEVWLDDFKLDGVTHVTFEAALNEVYHCNVSMNVRVQEIEGRMKVHIDAVDYQAIMELVEERAAARAATKEARAKAEELKWKAEELKWEELEGLVATERKETDP